MTVIVFGYEVSDEARSHTRPPRPSQNISIYRSTNSSKSGNRSNSGRHIFSNNSHIPDLYQISGLLYAVAIYLFDDVGIYIMVAKKR
jgi:hypothetical protein